MATGYSIQIVFPVDILGGNILGANKNFTYPKKYTRRKYHYAEDNIVKLF